MHKMSRLNFITKLFIPVVILILVSSPLVRGDQIFLSAQIGADGDNASIGSLGVGASIRTTSYYIENSPNPNVRNRLPRGDSFWVGDDLENGGFIQFGYVLNPSGYYCLGGAVIDGRATCQESVTFVGDGDARWFWEYFPIGTGGDYYFQLGLRMSAGTNGTWHSYSIAPFYGRTTGWEFRLDEQYVSSVNAPTSVSKDPVYVLAEHVTTDLPARLGPVEFSDLRYLTPNGWKSVEALYAISTCGVNTPCSFRSPYGVTALGPNHVVAGTGINQSINNKELLWPSTYSSPTRILTTTAPPILSTGSLIISMTSFASSLVIIAAVVAVAYKNRKGLQVLTKKIVSILSLPPPQPVERTESSQQRTDRPSEGATLSGISKEEMEAGIEHEPSRPGHPTKVKVLLGLAILHVAFLVLLLRSTFLTTEAHRLGTYASQLYLESGSGIMLLLTFFVMLAFSISWLAACIGLLIGTRWGWKLTLLLAAIGIADSLLTIWLGVWGFGALVLIIETVAIYCLTRQHVKVFFRNP